jgi:hypothetical protein
MPEILPSHLLVADRWRCVHFGSLSMDAESALAATNAAACTLDGALCATNTRLLAALAEAMQFPAYFGYNWDAVDECLADLGSWLPGSGYVLIVRNATLLWQVNPLGAGALVESWLDAAQEHAKEAKPFHLVFDLPGAIVPNA